MGLLLSATMYNHIWLIGGFSDYLNNINRILWIQTILLCLKQGWFCFGHGQGFHWTKIINFHELAIG